MPKKRTSSHRRSPFGVYKYIGRRSAKSDLPKTISQSLRFRIIPGSSIPEIVLPDAPHESESFRKNFRRILFPDPFCPYRRHCRESYSLVRLVLLPTWYALWSASYLCLDITIFGHSFKGLSYLYIGTYWFSVTSFLISNKRTRENTHRALYLPMPLSDTHILPLFPAYAEHHNPRYCPAPPHSTPDIPVPR